MTPKESTAHFPWQRMTICLLGCAMEWFFLNTHRNWVWAYFESMMLMAKPSPELAQVAQISVTQITVVTISAMTAVSFIVLFFVTGNVMALSSIFRFSSVNQAVGSVASEVESSFQDVTERIFNCDKLDPKDLDDEAFGDPHTDPQ